jgi:uroporphyrinogen-III synthase
MNSAFATGNPMKDKSIAILENRVGEQMADLVRKYGGTPICAPALAEIPDIDPAYISQLLERWTAAPPDYFIFQTGVGAKALFAATDGLGLTEQLLGSLKRARIIARGPKPTAALRSRSVRIDAGAKDPFTTPEVLAELDLAALSGKRVVVQRYGETNLELQKTLEESGAEITEIATYRWGLPADTQPLIQLMDALERHEIDAVAFTSASQATNLFTVAKQAGREASLKDNLNRALVASIGPVCTAALSKLGIKVDIEAHPPKLGPFISAINSALLSA